MEKFTCIVRYNEGRGYPPYARIFKSYADAVSFFRRFDIFETITFHCVNIDITKEEKESGYIYVNRKTWKKADEKAMKTDNNVGNVAIDPLSL